MPVEKQIQIDMKEWEELSMEDLNNISIINNFLYKHEAINWEENENTIIESLDEDMKTLWNNLKIKFENRITFIESNPNPNAYLVFTEQNKYADKQREQLTTIEGATEENKLQIENLIKDLDYLNSQSKLDYYLVNPEDFLKIRERLESMLQNFDQSKVSEYGTEIEDMLGFVDFFITNEQIKSAIDSYEKYDKDQKRIIEQLKNPIYLERLKKEFNCSEEVAQQHLNTRIANCSVWYNLDTREDSWEAIFSPNKNSANNATILPPKRENSGNRYTLFHEIWWHRVTNAEGVMGESSWGLSDYAKRELLISFDNWNNGDVYWSFFGDISYFENISERYARKKVMDFEMEDLWIKRYEEPFTENTFNKLMEFYNTTIQAINDGNYYEISAKHYHFLSKNSLQFIQTTKKDFSTYEKIFNNIA